MCVCGLSVYLSVGVGISHGTIKWTIREENVFRECGGEGKGSGMISHEEGWRLLRRRKPVRV